MVSLNLLFFLHMFLQKAKTEMVLLHILFFVRDLFGKLGKLQIIDAFF